MPRYEFSGRCFKEHRLRAGLQQEHVALSVHRAARTIARYEEGTVCPSAEMVSKLAAVLGVLPGDFYIVADAVPA